MSRSLFQKLKIREKIEKEMENMEIKCKFALRFKDFVKTGFINRLSGKYLRPEFTADTLHVFYKKLGSRFST